jgi:hypothetical protein
MLNRSYSDQLIIQAARDLMGLLDLLRQKSDDFAKQVEDDSEARALYTHLSAEAELHRNRLGSATGVVEDAGAALSMQEGGTELIAEEAQLNHLIGISGVMGDIVGKAERLAVISSRAGDSKVRPIAEAIRNVLQTCSDQICKLIPSRSKIAFNMLTVSELDPSVDTKMRDDRPV